MIFSFLSELSGTRTYQCGTGLGDGIYWRRFPFSNLNFVKRKIACYRTESQNFGKRFTNIIIGTRIGISFVGPNPDHQDLIGHLNPEVSLIFSFFPMEEEKPKYLSQVSVQNPSQVATSVIGTAVGTAFNGACTRGVAHGASYSIVGLGSANALDLKFLYLDSPDIFLQTFTAADGGFGNVPCDECWKSVRNAVDRGVVVISFTGSSR